MVNSLLPMRRSYCKLLMGCMSQGTIIDGFESRPGTLVGLLAEVTGSTKIPRRQSLDAKFLITKFLITEVIIGQCSHSTFAPLSYSFLSQSRVFLVCSTSWQRAWKVPIMTTEKNTLGLFRCIFLPLQSLQNAYLLYCTLVHAA